MEIGGVSPEGVAVPEIGVTPLVSTDTELEDELATPEDSPLLPDSSPEGVRLLGVCPAPRDLVDIELEKALLSVSIWPAMVTPLEEPVEVFPAAPSTYPEPPVPVLPYDDPGAPSGVSPLRVAADGPVLDVFPLYSLSPTCSVYEPVTSPLTPSLHEDADSKPPAAAALSATITEDTPTCRKNKRPASQIQTVPPNNTFKEISAAQHTARQHTGA